MLKHNHRSNKSNEFVTMERAGKMRKKLNFDNS